MVLQRAGRRGPARSGGRSPDDEVEDAVGRAQKLRQAAGRPARSGAGDSSSRPADSTQNPGAGGGAAPGSRSRLRGSGGPRRRRREPKRPVGGGVLEVQLEKSTRWPGIVPSARASPIATVVLPSSATPPTTPIRRSRLSRPSARSGGRASAAARRGACARRTRSRHGRGRARRPVSSSNAGSSSTMGIWVSAELTARASAQALVEPDALELVAGRRVACRTGSATWSGAPPAAPRSRSRGTSRRPRARRAAAAVRRGPGPRPRALPA